MAIITDPDLIGRFDTIFGTQSQEVSIYPVGDTQRGATLVNCFVASTSTITNTDGSGWVAIATEDVAAVLDGPDAGHYFVDAGATTATLTIVEIDDGHGGSAGTSLTVAATTVDMTTISGNAITISSHGYVSGQAIVYTSLGGGSADSGLSLNTVYYIIWIDANTIEMATTYANALAGSAITLTGDATGTTHIFDNRILVGVFNNGASSVVAATTPTGEFILGNETTGDDDGDVKDGISIQAIYSFGKDEWRVDSLISDISGDYNDDLIRTEFALEAITSEQFEVGGGAAHDNWNWFNEYTRKKAKTGGWAERTKTQVAAQDLARWTGIVTLGTLDIDTQVYYQQVDSITTKVDFTFTGVVNEAVQIQDDPNQDGAYGDGFNRLTYLKLFARKKGRTYAQSEISDIGVSTLQTIVNRFPLTAVTDAAITITDPSIFGTNPYKFAADPDGTSAEIETGTDGTKSAVLTFTSGGSTFQANNVAVGDILRITLDPTSTISDVGYYSIATVTDETNLVLTDVEFVDGNGDFVFNGDWQSVDDSTDVEFDIYTSIITANQTTGAASDGIELETPAEVAATALGSLIDANNDSFVTDGVASGDILVITGGVTDTNDVGVYKVVDANYDSNAAAPTSSKIFINTADEEWPGSVDDLVDYEIRQPGMFLQFRDQLTETKVSTASANEDIVFAAAGRTITLGTSVGDWDASITAGTMIVVTGTDSNDGRYTVLTRDSGTVITLITGDVLVNETNTDDPVATVAVREGFTRIIGTGTFAFRWRLFGNGGSLQECFEFIQNQLRDSADIDFGTGTAIGNITDLLMSFASPTGTTIDLYIDDILTSDINNATFGDHSAVARNFPFTASGNLVFNSNLEGDTDARYWLFFSNDDAGDNLARDYGTQDAIIVEDATSVPVQIFGDVNGTGNHTGVAGTVDAANNISIPFTFDYDVNVQRGSASAATNAPVTLVAIGLTSAQFVIAAGTVTRATGISITAVAALERNYLVGSV